MQDHQKTSRTEFILRQSQRVVKWEGAKALASLIPSSTPVINQKYCSFHSTLKVEKDFLSVL